MERMGNRKLCTSQEIEIEDIPNKGLKPCLVLKIALNSKAILIDEDFFEG